MTDEAERKHDPAGRADEHADALLNSFDEIDRENRTKNAMAHPAGGSRLHAGGWPHCTDRPRRGR
jgi:hypothetical protein